MTAPKRQRRPKPHPLDCLPESLSAIELGRLFRVSSRVIYDLAQRGIVRRADQPGRFLTRASFDAYQDHLSAMAASRGAEDGAPSLAQERAETERIVRAREKIKLERELSEILYKPEAVEVWARLVDRFRAGVIAIKTKMSAQFPNLTAIDHANVRDTLAEILIDLEHEIHGDLPPGAATHLILDDATRARLKAV